MNSKTRKSVAVRQIQGILAFFLLSLGSSHAAITTENSSSNTVTSGSSLNTITFVGTGALTEIENCGALTPAIPGGSTGDLLIASIAARDTGTNIATPAGWTRFGESTYTGQALKAFLYYRIATGTDAVTFTTTGSCVSTGVRVVRFSGVDPADPIEPLPIPYITGNANVTQTNSGDITTGSINTSVATAMVIVSTYINDNRTVSEVGYTQSFDDSRNVSLDYGHGLFYQLQTTTGSKSVSAWDLFGGGSDENIDFIYALKPGTTPIPPGSIAVSVPAGLQIGDVMVATISVISTDTVTESGTSDWTLENRINHTDTRSAQLVLSRIVDGTEAGNYTWALGANVLDAAIGIVNYRGVDTTSAIDVLGGNETASGTTHTANSINTTVTDAMVISAHSFTSSENWTVPPPSGMTQRVGISSRTPSNSEGISLQMSDVIQPAAGATGPKSATVGGNADTGIAHLLALRPSITTAAVITPATGGDAISADIVGTSYVTLIGPVISELDIGGMVSGNYTLTIPAGYEFNPASSVGILITGSGVGADLTLGTTTVNSTTITFNVATQSGGSRLNTLTFSGIEVRPTTSCPISPSGNIIFAAATLTTITENNAGTLTEVAGTATSMYTVLPSQSIYDNNTCGTVRG